MSEQEIQRLREQVEALQKFKDWVHAYLDGKGIPADPDPERREKSGCRIGCRMDAVFAEVERLRTALRALATAADTAMYSFYSQSAEFRAIGEALRKAREVLGGR